MSEGGERCWKFQERINGRNGGPREWQKERVGSVVPAGDFASAKFSCIGELTESLI